MIYDLPLVVGNKKKRGDGTASLPERNIGENSQ